MASEIDLSKYPAGSWRIPQVPKVKYLKIRDVTPINRLLLRITAKETATPEPINIFGVLAHLRGTLKYYLFYFSHLYKHGAISINEKEIITLRTAWRLGSLYEYVHHRDFLEKNGFDKELIDSYTTEDSELWDDRLKAVFPAVDDIVSAHTVAPEHWEALRRCYDDDQLVEFLMYVGYFIMIAIIIDASGVVLE